MLFFHLLFVHEVKHLGWAVTIVGVQLDSGDKKLDYLERHGPEESKECPAALCIFACCPVQQPAPVLIVLKIPANTTPCQIEGSTHRDTIIIVRRRTRRPQAGCSAFSSSTVSTQCACRRHNMLKLGIGVSIPLVEV